MARQLFDIGLFSVLTSGAALGIGWKLHFYTGGTTTPITTYNARTAGSANSNPVIADGNGRFDEIWIEEGQTIKWVLADENDSTAGLPSLDNYLISAAPATVDAGLVTFLAGSAALPIANGGTASTSAANARTALAVLALAGGTVTGNIVRSGKGAHLYFSDSAMVNPTLFLTAAASADPRGGLPGQIWLKY